ncbi:hypothetical protein GXW82_24455 [Streptacidiphilus sp. 4-A2]|nr:hypothetical protein [Streptacidiphilus sp. 4-A2]
MAACGAVQQISAGEKLSTAFGKVGDSDTLSVSFSLDATPAQLVALDAGDSDALKLADAKNIAGLGATLTLSSGKPLGQTLKSLKTSSSGTFDVSQYPGLDLDLEIHSGGRKPLFEVRQVAGTEYLRVYLDNLEALGGSDGSTGQEIAGMQAEAGQMPPQYAPLKDLIAGKWVSYDPRQMAALAKNMQSAGVGSGGPTSLPSLSASTRNNLVSALTNLFEQNITLSDRGTTDGVDHIVLQAPEQKLVDGIQQAFAPVAKAIPGLGSSYPTAAPTGVPDRNVSADAYIGQDGSLSKLSIDLGQLDSGSNGHLPLSLSSTTAPGPGRALGGDRDPGEPAGEPGPEHGRRSQGLRPHRQRPHRQRLHQHRPGHPHRRRLHPRRHHRLTRPTAPPPHRPAVTRARTTLVRARACAGTGRQPVMLGVPVSRWPVKRRDQEESRLLVTVKSYQPLS